MELSFGVRMNSGSACAQRACFLFLLCSHWLGTHSFPRKIRTQTYCCSEARALVWPNYKLPRHRRPIFHEGHIELEANASNCE